jgi:hypothetical protein
MNIHNKNGQKFVVDQKVLVKLNKNEYFHNLMNWVEKMLTMTTNLVSPEFFHPSFTKTERDFIVGFIYTLYPNVKDIQRIEPDGVIIKCDTTLNTEELQKKIDNMSN